MRFNWALSLAAVTASAVSVYANDLKGIEDLVKRRMPDHVNDFSFKLVDAKGPVVNNTDGAKNDEYTVTCANAKVAIQGSSVSALATGLHRYLADVAHVDVYWFLGSELDQLPSTLPGCSPINGSSIVPWRYHFNTVTFSYTTAFWSWEDWELELDWLALNGVNMPLAWVGFEKTLYEVFEEVGLTDAEIVDFLSGPAFQSWNRFGNIQGSWGGDLPKAWINGQFELQKKIIKRMEQLGMTPVLPAFTGFVPRALAGLYPNASIVNGSNWEAFPTKYSNDSFLDPSDPLFTQLQKSFIHKQQKHYSTKSHIYTLDQFNENNPFSGDLDYLKNLTYNIWQSFKAADSDAIWMLQGWLFFSSSSFWTNERVEAYLSGVTVNTDMLILDLFSETQPQWQRLNSYYGKPWIWCQLHDYGGNTGLYGQVMNVTINPIEALANSSSLVGFGLTMEGQEGNEIMYRLLLDQAWSATPIDLPTYFQKWATTRYAVGQDGTLPDSIHQAWSILMSTVYNNTKLTSQAVTKSILELSPNVTGLANRTGHHPTTINYNTNDLVKAWDLFISAAESSPSLWSNAAYQFDLVDFTRQVLANAFNPVYSSFVAQTNLTALTTDSTTQVAAAKKTQANMLDVLATLDNVLLHTPSEDPAASLAGWLAAAQDWIPSSASDDEAYYYIYNALNQITLWGPDGEVSDYASRQWGSLVANYYLPRWTIWSNAYIEALESGVAVDKAVLQSQLLSWEQDWQYNGGGSVEAVCPSGLESVIADVKDLLASI